MTILLLEGFENWGTEANFEKVWDGTGDIDSFSSSTVRTGTYSAKLYYNGDDIIYSFPCMTTICVGFAIYSDSFGTDATILTIGNDNCSHANCLLRVNGNTLYINTGGVIYYPSGSLVPSVWNYIECRLLASDTVGECEVRLNGATVLDETGIDTNYSISYGERICQIGISGDPGPFAGYVYIDDVYITTGEFLGPIKIYSFLPTSNGTHTDFTPLSGSNYENVDEAAPDDDTSYNTGDDLGEKDTYNLTVSGVTGSIKGVGVRYFASKTSPLAIHTKAITRVSSTDYQGSKTAVPTEGYGVYHDYWAVNPDTSNPWTVSDVTSAEFGIEITGFATTTTA
jgi:hypothetical protein